MTTLGPPSVKQCPSTWSDRRCISIAGHIEPSHHDHEHEWSDADAATNGRATGADERLAAASAQVGATSIDTHVAARDQDIRRYLDAILIQHIR